MAITRRSQGAWVWQASGSISPTGATHAATDMLLVRVLYKSSAIATCSASTATSGWAKVGEFHDGTTNSGNGTGSVAVAMFWKEAASSSETFPTVDFSQTVTQVGCTLLVYQKGAGETWETPVGDGGGFAAGTNVTATIQSHVSVTAGDVVDFLWGARDDSTPTVPTFTQTGVTYDTVTEHNGESNTTGADATGDGCFRTATAGTSSAAAVGTWTLSTSESGSAWMTRLRVSAGGTNAAAGHASGTASAFAASILLAVSAGLASGSGAAFNATTQVSKTVSAGHAAGTGQANNVGGTISFISGHASGTGLARAPTVNIQPNAGHASGAGVARDVDATVAGAPTVATGSGSAFQPSISIGTHAGHASGTGAAFDATAQPGKAADAGHAAGTGTANNPTPALASSAGSAAGSGTAGGPSSSIAVGPGVSSGTGQAFDATVSVAAFTNAAAGHASGTGQAFNPSASIASSSGAAAGTGSAGSPSAGIATNAAAGSGTGASGEAHPDIEGAPNIATGTGAAGGPSPAIAVHGGAAVGTGTARNATANTGQAFTDVNAGLASGTGTAYNATVKLGSGKIPGVLPFKEGTLPKEQLRVHARPAYGVGIAYDAWVDANDDETLISILLPLLDEPV